MSGSNGGPPPVPPTPPGKPITTIDIQKRMVRYPFTHPLMTGLHHVDIPFAMFKSVCGTIINMEGQAEEAQAAAKSPKLWTPGTEP